MEQVLPVIDKDHVKIMQSEQCQGIWDALFIEQCPARGTVLYIK